VTHLGAIGMRIPPQVKPVKRPDLIQPHTTVEVVYGDAEDLVSIRAHLTHGANYNDPPRLRMPGYARMTWTCFTCPPVGWV
jgi:cyanobactin biosynthesis protein (PatB/AcyB/McaB family)